MLSFGMLSARAARTAARRRGFIAGSGRPSLAATVISRESLPNTLERTASCRPLRCMMFLNCEWPAKAASGKSASNQCGRVIILHAVEIKRQRSFPETRPRLGQLPAEPHRRNAQRKTGCVVDLDRERAQGRRAIRRLELARGDAAHEALQRLRPCYC